MSFFDTLCEMLVILFAIAAGYLSHRLGFLGGDVDKRVSRLILNITMPAMIVAAVITGDTLPALSEVLAILEVGVVFYLLEALFMLAVPRIFGGTPGERGVWRYAMMFPNVGFIGYPVAVALFGQEALFFAVVLALPFNLMSFTLGPLLLVGAKRFKVRQMFSPCVLASLLALALALSGLRPPALLGEMLDFVGGITVPLSLLLVGSLLAGLPVGEVFASPRLWLLSVLRLLVMPVLLSLILGRMDFGYMAAGVAVSQMAMPVAVNGSMLCMEYGGDAESMARITFLTTLASIVTIPLMAALLL
ncbi:MAG: AEC family transporter [Oscillospiraceae bacterium]|nr:AEC family transporter [Oscillospiraceae bacterium]